LRASFLETLVPRPHRQIVVVSFDDGYLTNPGLWDPVDATQADRDLLDSLSGLVADGIMTMLRDMFADSPIEIVAESGAPPGEPSSRLTFKPDRVLADDQDTIDTALPPADPTRPQCQARVVFGEVLPRDASIDLGNRILDDEAVVYVGSFQGRGEECWFAAINSVNNIVLSLSQTAAHEIGHLVGLHHVEQIDLMNRSATLAFFRKLPFTRGQVQLDRFRNGERSSEVFTSIIQDPAVYFRSIFAANLSQP
jgi:hypothetical protein